MFVFENKILITRLSLFARIALLLIRLQWFLLLENRNEILPANISGLFSTFEGNFASWCKIYNIYILIILITSFKKIRNGNSMNVNALGKRVPLTLYFN